LQNKITAKRVSFQDVSEIQEQLQTVRHVIPKYLFQLCFQQWQKHWTCCINSEDDFLKVTAMTSNKGEHIFIILSGVMVIVLATEPKVRRFKPGQG
jgi:hypothetical protein